MRTFILAQPIKLLSLAGIIVLGAILRLSHLAKFPRGIHGDEGWTGMRAWDLVNGVSIGVFDPVHSIGQWASPIYATVPFILWIDDPVVAVRLPMALMGVASLIMFTSFAYLSIGFTPSLFIAALLASFPAHIILSRVGMPPITYLFFQAVTLWLCAMGVYNGRRLYFVLTGVALGAGSMFYGAFPAFGVSFFISFILVLLVDKTFLKGTKLQSFVLIIVGTLPFVLLYAHTIINTGALTSRAESAFLIADGQVLTATIWKMLLRVTTASFITPQSDGSDGLGEVLFLDWTLLGAFILSATITFRSKSPWFKAVLLTLTTNLFLGIFISKMDFGLYRRVITIFPLFFWIAAFGLSSEKGNSFVKAVIICFLSISLLNNGRKLVQTYHSQNVNWVYCQELTQAALWLRDLNPPPERIVLYSSRWSANYEVMRYLLKRDQKYDNINIIDKSKEFGQFSLTSEPPKTAIVLLGKYQNLLDQIKALNPRGEPFSFSHTLFSAYETH